MISISYLSLIKSFYTLSLIYFEFPLLRSNPAIFSSLLSILNLPFSLLPRKPLLKTILNNFIFSLFLVFVSGANPFSWNTWAFSGLLSSVGYFELFTNPEIVLKYLLFSSLLIYFYFTLTPPSLFNLKLFNLPWTAFVTLGSLIGSFLTGLLVILDWNEGWQKFPIPNVIGCIFGEFCGLVIYFILQKVQKLKK